MAENSLFAPMVNPSASRWVVSTPNAKLVAEQMRMATTEKLLAKAASLAPDAVKLNEYLSKHKIAPGDMAQYQTALNSMYDDWMTKYNENPFSAFDKESKDKVKQMQRLVNDPNITRLENLYNTADKERERLKDNLGVINYDKGVVKVYDKTKNKIVSIDALDFDPTSHEKINLKDEYDYRVNVSGFAADPTPFQANMSKYEDVVKRVDDFLSKTGKTKGESVINEFVTAIQSSNRSQLESKARFVIEGAGLSDSDKNTIYGRYYDEVMSSGQKPSKADADAYFLNFVSKIAQGHTEDDITTKKSIKLEVAEASKALKGGVESIALPASAGQFGVRNVELASGTKVRSFQVNNLPDYTTMMGRKIKYKDSQGNEIEDVKKDLSLFVFAGASKSKFYLADQAPGSASRDMIVQGDDFAKIKDAIHVTETPGLVAIPYTVVNGQKDYNFDAAKNPTEAQGQGINFDLMYYVTGQVGAINKYGVIDYFKDNSLQMDKDITATMTRLGIDGREVDFESDEVQNYIRNIRRTGLSADAADYDEWLDQDDNLKMYNVNFFMPIEGSNVEQQYLNLDKALDAAGVSGAYQFKVPPKYSSQNIKSSKDTTYVPIEALSQ